MLGRPSEEHYGLELSRAAHLASGTIYPILRRLEQRGWVVSRWEDVDPSEQGRPRKRLYQLTGHGAQLARKQLPTDATAATWARIPGTVAEV